MRGKGSVQFGPSSSTEDTLKFQTTVSLLTETEMQKRQWGKSCFSYGFGFDDYGRKCIGKDHKTYTLLEINSRKKTDKLVAREEESNEIQDFPIEFFLKRNKYNWVDTKKRRRLISPSLDDIPTKMDLVPKQEDSPSNTDTVPKQEDSPSNTNTVPIQSITTNETPTKMETYVVPIERSGQVKSVFSMTSCSDIRVEYENYQCAPFDDYEIQKLYTYGNQTSANKYSLVQKEEHMQDELLTRFLDDYQKGMDVMKSHPRHYYTGKFRYDGVNKVSDGNGGEIKYTPMSIDVPDNSHISNTSLTTPSTILQDSTTIFTSADKDSIKNTSV